MRGGHLRLVDPGGVATAVAEPGPVKPVPLAGSAQRVKLVDATLRCLERNGIARTTLDDVATEAGCSRATVYRCVPGGKDALIAAAVSTEVSRLFSTLAVAVGQAGDLEEALTVAISTATRWIAGHGVLQRLCEHEPQLLLPHLAFTNLETVLEKAARFGAPFLGRWLGFADAARVGEWAARIVVSYLAAPDTAADLADPAVARHLVRSFVIPAVAAATSPPGARPPAGHRRFPGVVLGGHTGEDDEDDEKEVGHD